MGNIKISIKFDCYDIPRPPDMCNHKNKKSYFFRCDKTIEGWRFVENRTAANGKILRIRILHHYMYHIFAYYCSVFVSMNRDRIQISIRSYLVVTPMGDSYSGELTPRFGSLRPGENPQWHVRSVQNKRSDRLKKI